MLDKLLTAFNAVQDNVWAFLLFLLASILAVVGGVKHLDSLIHFAETVAMTGAALFHGKEKKEP